MEVMEITTLDEEKDVCQETAKAGKKLSVFGRSKEVATSDRIVEVGCKGKENRSQQRGYQAG